MNESDPISRLLSLPAFATSGDVALKPGFERIEALLAGMGHPERDREIILVAGTNGKGSTASMLAAMSTAAGIRTGLHTSPHLLHVSERMRVDGRAPSEDWLSTAVGRWETLFEAVEPSFFEATLALSLHWFAECDARRWVVEIGLGGRLDAANVLNANLGILTSVGRDHMHLLGPTLADVAAEKAAIGRAKRPFVLGPLADEPRSAALAVLKRIGALVIEPEPEDGILDSGGGLIELKTSRRGVAGVELPLPGRHQRMNALLALEAIDQLHDVPVEAAIVERGLRDLHLLSGLRGRQEWVYPDVMVDVGHNEDALRAAITSFIDKIDDNERCIILGFLEDKDLGSLGEWLWNRTSGSNATLRVVVVETDGARGLQPREARMRLENSGWRGPIHEVSDPVEALRQAREQGMSVLVGGSYRVAAPVLRALEA